MVSTTLIRFFCIILEDMIANGESGSYDFAFIDADKPGYDEYYELCLQLMRKDGIIALDNVSHHAIVLLVQ